MPKSDRRFPKSLSPKAYAEMQENDQEVWEGIVEETIHRQKHSDNWQEAD